MAELDPVIRGDFHLHTNTEAASQKDGGLSPEHIRGMLDSQWLHVIGITDHDTIAPETFQLAREYPGRIFVGEEITTLHQGNKVEIIGLDLKEEIPGGQSTLDAAQAIADQEGLLYIPHPFEPARKGVSLDLLNWIYALYEIAAIERHNSRSWSSKPGKLAVEWAAAHNVATAVGSDAHGPKGWGRAYTVLSEHPVKETFSAALTPHPIGENRAGALGRVQPKANVIGKKLGVERLQTANWKL